MSDMYERAGLGLDGPVAVLAASGTAQSGPYYAMKAIGGDVTFGAGCTTAGGVNVPRENDVLSQGDELVGQFTKIVLAAGSVGVLYLWSL